MQAVWFQISLHLFRFILFPEPGSYPVALAGLEPAAIPLAQPPERVLVSLYPVYPRLQSGPAVLRLSPTLLPGWQQWPLRVLRPHGCMAACGIFVCVFLVTRGPEYFQHSLPFINLLCEASICLSLSSKGRVARTRFPIVLW